MGDAEKQPLLKTEEYQNYDNLAGAGKLNIIPFCLR